MIYEFECACGHDWTESRTIAKRNEAAICAHCGGETFKREIPSRLGGIYGAADWDSAHWNQGLGMACRNNLHAKKEAKRRGLTEVGDADVDKVAKSMENERKKRLDYDISQITNLGEINSK